VAGAAHRSGVGRPGQAGPTGGHADPVPRRWGGPIDLHNWRTRDWYPALEAAGIDKRGPYHLRHTFATEALAAGVSIFELARLMGTSVAMIDERYGHLARDSEAAILARLEARSSVQRMDVRP
jgi:integrase